MPVPWAAGELGLAFLSQHNLIPGRTALRFTVCVCGELFLEMLIQERANFGKVLLAFWSIHGKQVLGM